jgi:hypothetical protein
MREAIPFHLEGMRLNSDELLEPMPIVKQSTLLRSCKAFIKAR